MKLKIATWNINSIRLRENLVCRLLKEYAPDILCLQETKSLTQDIPRENFNNLGYKHQVYRGQKSYNGVAIISRIPIENTQNHDFCLKGDARHIKAKLTNGLTIENFYVPAGGDVADVDLNEKFAHKISFLDEMTEKFKKIKPKRTILVGDLNIAPFENDVWSHKQLVKVVSHTPIEVKKLESILEAGRFVDLTRKHIPDGKLYSWWSYRSKDWKKSDRGRRLDHVWATEDMASMHSSSFILKEARDWQRPSDHVPVFAELNL